MNISGKSKITPQLAFLVLFTGVVLYTLVLFLTTGGENLFGLFFSDIIDNFMDLFNPLKFVYGGDPYKYVELGAMYPALCYVICDVTAFFLPADYRTMSPYDMGNHPQGVILLAIWTVILAGAIIAYVLCFLKNRKVYYVVAVVFSCLYSAPVVFLWSRMNFLILALAFLLMFIIGKDSKNKVIRELSYVCLAISAAIKIYPAVFGVLLVLEKRWFDTIRCAIYGLIVFFVPFWYFDGITSIKNFLHNLIYGIGFTDYEWTGVAYRIDFKNNLAILKWLIGGDPSVTPPSYKPAMILVLVVLAAGLFIFTDKWKKVLCVTMIMVLAPSFNYAYSASFYLIPMVLFMSAESSKENQARCPADRIFGYFYAAALVMLLAPFTGPTRYMSDRWAIESRNPLTDAVFHQNIGQLILITVVAVDLCVASLRLIKRITDRNRIERKEQT